MIAETSTPERLYLMQIAGYPPSNTPAAVCYLIQTSEGSNILIDSGMPINLHLTPVHLAKMADTQESSSLLSLRAVPGSSVRHRQSFVGLFCNTCS
jgi:hypothetical protein